jgi:hypothetical protein
VNKNTDMAARNKGSREIESSSCSRGTDYREDRIESKPNNNPD